MEWDELVKVLGDNWEHIKTALILLSPPLTTFGGWIAAHRKLKMEADDREKQRQLQALEQIERQRSSLHEETVQQTQVLTAQFNAIIAASEARTKDLYGEVESLRKEVIYLRKTIDRQRLLCVGCPKLPLLNADNTNAQSVETA